MKAINPHVMECVIYRPCFLVSKLKHIRTNKKLSAPGHIWFIYYWNRQPSHRFNRKIGRLESEENPTAYPDLAQRVDSFPSESNDPISYVAFRPSSETEPKGFFLRQTDTWGIWHYRWAGLETECDISVQKQIRGGPHQRGLDEDDNVWPQGRLRAIVFGFGDSWVLYRGKKVDYRGPLHIKFREALLEGRKHKRSINVSLNVSLNSDTHVRTRKSP
jgi:hypothetical protein